MIEIFNSQQLSCCERARLCRKRYKAQRYRSQDQNKADALARLQKLIKSVSTIPRPRNPPKRPSKASKEKLKTDKRQHSQLKQNRKVKPSEY